MLLIAGGRVLDPGSGIDEDMHVLVDGGRVEALLRPGHSYPPGAEVLDASDMVVAPGFIDVHAHLRYPGQPDKETVASATSAAVRGGFTTVCSMANTVPAIDSPDLVDEVLRRYDVEARCRVFTFGSVSEKLEGHRPSDVGALVGAGAIGLSDDGKPIWNSDLMESALSESERRGTLFSVHEEDHAGATGPEYRWPCSGEVQMIERDLELLRRHGGRLHIAHVSCARSVELLASAQAEGLGVTAEVTPHHLAMDDKIWDGTADLPPEHGFAKVNPPLRSRADGEVLASGLQSGVFGAIATDHAPHTAAEKCCTPGLAVYGYSGFEFALPLLLSLVEAGRVGLETVVRGLTCGPATILGLPLGTLRVGSSADICIFDPNAEWQCQSDTLVSKGKNNPMARKQLKGRVVATLVEGRVFEFGEDHGLRALRTS